MRSHHVTDRAAGFTLVELTIVLVIVALLIGGMLLPLSAQRDLQSISETEKQLSEIKEALTGFAIINGRLPRPANSATDGTERSVCSNDADCTGFIPWQALGIQATDSWNKLIRYSVSPSFSNSTFSLTTKATKKIQTRDSAGNTAYLFGQASCTNPTDNLCSPAVIFSQGKQRFGTSTDGVTLSGGTATSIDEAANDSGGGVSFMSRTATDNTAAAGGEFDDIVTWISPVVLFNRMVAAGKLP